MSFTPEVPTNLPDRHFMEDSGVLAKQKAKWDPVVGIMAHLPTGNLQHKMPVAKEKSWDAFERADRDV